MSLDGGAGGDGFAPFDSAFGGDYFPVASDETVRAVASVSQQQAAASAGGVTMLSALQQPQHAQQQAQAPLVAALQAQQHHAAAAPSQAQQLPGPGQMRLGGVAPLYPAPMLPLAYQAPAQQAAPAAALPEPGYFELLWARRREIVKLVVLSLVVLLAISSHSTVWHYLQDYVDLQQLEGGKELAVRLAYPAAVLVLLWHFKAFLQR